MPEFKVFTRINAPYKKVWELACRIENVEKWAPVKFKSISSDEPIVNGLKLKQEVHLFGLFRKDLVVKDAYTNSEVRRQYSLVDSQDKYGFNRITYMFDDNSLSTMIALSEDREAIEVMKEQAKTEPEFQIDVMCHIFYTYGSNFWRQFIEFLFINPFFSLVYKKKAEKTLSRLKALAEP